MGLWLFLIFVALPIVEIALFVVVGGAIGVLWTLGLVILAAFTGLTIIRVQGMQALGRLRDTAGAVRDPLGPIANAALVVVAGILLVLPGFLTDAIGVMLLVPPVRHALIGWGAARVTLRATTYAQARRARSGPHEAEIIEADYEIVDEGKPRRQGSSGWTRPQP